MRGGKKARNPIGYMNNPRRGGKGVRGKSRMHARHGKGKR